mgnify:CR=1 FL=1
MTCEKDTLRCSKFKNLELGLRTPVLLESGIGDCSRSVHEKWFSINLLPLRIHP